MQLQEIQMFETLLRMFRSRYHHEMNLGSFCQNCNCESCQNIEEFSEIRAKAIDEMIMRSSINFGQKGSTAKGCNCRKTGCLKKYC